MSTTTVTANSSFGKPPPAATTPPRATRVHMVGIGGSGMSGLAALLARRGEIVSGSDATLSLEAARLAAAGVRIVKQEGRPTLPEALDVVVASAAIAADHPDLQEARRRQIPVLKYAQMLGRAMGASDGIAISGTHGKSTTTAWLTYVLKGAGLDPSFVIGAQVPQLGGGSGVGDGPHFIVEACEYDRSFLNLAPQRAAILNIEEDHLDYYRDLAEIRAAFGEFARRLPPHGLLVTNEDDEDCRAIAAQAACRVTTFGASPTATWRAADIACDGGHFVLDVHHAGHSLGRVRLGIPGRQNVDNALTVSALAHDCGVAWAAIAAGLAGFAGADRRLQLRGEVRGIRVVDDYAHHPTEIRVTLVAARDRYAPRRLWCVFQPHQHSRTRFLLADFARTLTQADRVVVPDIYFVRDTERDRQAVCAADLVREIRGLGGDATYVPTFAEIVELLARAAEPGDVVLTMGAGPIWKVADELVQRLGGNLPA